jgi:hypothetical protein
MVPVLDSPQPFGIYIDYGKGQILKRFQKGKTVLTELEAKALEAHQYTKDNGAEIIFKKNPNKK